jgi:hypothetical protein
MKRNSKGSKVYKKNTKLTFDDLEKDENVYVHAEQITGHALLIKTTNSKIKDLLKDFEKDSRKETIYICNSAYHCIKSQNIDDIYKNPILFENYCTDVIIVYVARYILYGSVIPITPFDCISKEKQEEFNKLQS